MIEIKNLSKSFKKNLVLDNVSLKINKGELVALIGPSGCGKTTTLKMINALLKPTSGDVFIDGKSILSQNIIDLRRTMGYVIQQTGLFPHMTVQENIEIVSKLMKKPKENIEKRTRELMDLIGLEADTYLHRYPPQLSGGQLQRIGVARAFATDPEIILMDEPFSALDPITREQLQNELVFLQSKLRKTIVFVTHDMDEAIKLADKICVMNNGRIMQFDTPENILKNPVNSFVSDFVGKKRIWSNPEYIRVKDIMIVDPVCAFTDISLLKAIEIMRFHNVDSVLVVNENKQYMGVVKANAIQREADRNIPVSQIMIPKKITVDPDCSIIDVLKILRDNKMRNIAVTSKSGKLLGIITQSRLVTTLSTQFIDFDSEGESA